MASRSFQASFTIKSRTSGKALLAFTSLFTKNSPEVSGLPWSVRSMSLRSVYLAAPSFKNDRLHVAGDEHRHLAVARAEPDELIEVFDGNGHVWTAAIESVGKRETIARVTASRTAPPPSVDLFLGMA